MDANHDAWLASQLTKTAEVKRLTDRLEGSLRLAMRMKLSGPLAEAQQLTKDIESEMSMLRRSIDEMLKS